MLQELINKLNDAMQAIQNLQLQPTEHNCSRVVAALTAIREAGEMAINMSEELEKLKQPEQAEQEVTEDVCV